MESLRHLTIEEMYELTDAISDEDYPKSKRNWEIVMMYLVFYARIACIGKSVSYTDKSERLGFDWEDKKQVWEKVEEENWPKFKAEFNIDNGEPIDAGKSRGAEFGDLRFSLTIMPAHVGINPENASERDKKKFIKRLHTWKKKKRSENNQKLQEMFLSRKWSLLERS
ncbi:hypothetical protein FQR65_LT17590 [Abscondita terminalis]|nr:hypothetical protein FQR65_LT17590 [Abscondita terminalis]